MCDSLKHPVGRNRDHIELINLVELFGFRHRGTGHPTDFVIEFEVVLQRDRGQRLSLFFDLHAFFGFNSLMQSITPLTTIHQTTGELIDDHDFAFFDDVVDVFLVKTVSLEGIVDHVRPIHVARCVETFNASKLFRVTNAFVG